MVHANGQIAGLFPTFLLSVTELSVGNDLNLARILFSRGSEVFHCDLGFSAIPIRLSVVLCT